MRREHEKMLRLKNPYHADEGLKKLIGVTDQYEALCYDAMTLCDGSFSELTKWSSMHGFSNAETMCIIKIVRQANIILSSRLNASS